MFVRISHDAFTQLFHRYLSFLALLLLLSLSFCPLFFPPSLLSSILLFSFLPYFIFSVFNCLEVLSLFLSFGFSPSLLFGVSFLSVVPPFMPSFIFNGLAFCLATRSSFNRNHLLSLCSARYRLNFLTYCRSWCALESVLDYIATITKSRPSEKLFVCKKVCRKS